MLQKFCKSPLFLRSMKLILEWVNLAEIYQVTKHCILGDCITPLLFTTNNTYYAAKRTLKCLNVRLPTYALNILFKIRKWNLTNIGGGRYFWYLYLKDSKTSHFIMKSYFYKSLITSQGKVLKPKKVSLQPQKKDEAVF